ncbi:TetR/AcrR family transcriptional regulator [Mycobacterium sp. E796]|uniref:TetR/AcrR family transcriptional regulator n=1 Tax=Mycobacterium sp. E796 TaxID=1834151 RepID=UPI0007FD272C|nr:TetR/AcrR family transcriptional regulator [Mycobacterium sp. E796]OBI51984.1 hypothetical protein A5706_01950 [Mycobacterium sp. E796]
MTIRGRAATTGEGRGRPRDPAADDRIMRAALEEYARSGWSGFSIDGVARTARVGKSSIYLRWRTKEQLLLDSVRAYASPLTTDIDSGTLLGDLHTLTVSLLRYFLDPAGWTTVRIAIDSKSSGPMQVLSAQVRPLFLAMSSVILQRAVDRGEVDAAVCPQAATEVLFGAVLMHVISLDPDSFDDACANADDHVAPLVKIVAGGLSRSIGV